MGKISFWPFGVLQYLKWPVERKCYTAILPIQHPVRIHPCIGSRHTGLEVKATLLSPLCERQHLEAPDSTFHSWIQGGSAVSSRFIPHRCSRRQLVPALIIALTALFKSHSSRLAILLLLYIFPHRSPPNMSENNVVPLPCLQSLGDSKKEKGCSSFSLEKKTKHIPSLPKPSWWAV